MNKRRAGRWVSITVGMALFCMAPCLADDAEESPGTLLERTEREMVRLRVQIKNARIRMENRIQGMDQGAPDPGKPLTPVNFCCTANVKKIAFAVDQLNTIFGELARCYEDTGDVDGSLRVPIVAEDLRAVSQVAEMWAAAPTEDQAQGGMAGMTRAYLKLLQDTDQLEPCPAADSGASAEPTKKKKKKDKKKGKQKDEDS